MDYFLTFPWILWSDINSQENKMQIQKDMPRERKAFTLE